MNLNEMTVPQLREIAAGFNITGRSKMKKADLVGSIEAAQIAARSVELFKQAAHIEDGLKADADAGTYSFVNEVAILRDAPGRAIVTAAFDGKTVGGSIIRKGKRLVLRVGNITVTGNTFDKVAKRLASKLGFRADIIDVARNF